MKRSFLIILLLLTLAGQAFATVDSTPQTVTYNTGGVNTFSFAFSIGQTTDIQVLLDGTVLPSSAYTVTCAAYNCTTGGTVTTTTTYPAGHILTVNTNIPITQGSIFTNNMPALYKTFEVGLDKLTRIDKQLEASLSSINSHYQILQNGGTSQTQRNAFNLIAGTNVGLSFADNPTHNSTDVTISATGGGGGGSGYWLDASSYPSINAAVTAIGATRATLLVSNTQTLAGNLVVPSNIALMVVEGGSIVKASSYNLTINGTFSSGLYQAFSGFSAGNVVFGAGTVTDIYPQWWGAMNNGTSATATTLAIQCAASAGRTNTIPIRMVGGNYAVNDSLNFTCAGAENWRLKGDGQTATWINGTLSSAYPVVDCSGSEGMVVEDIGIAGNAGGSQSTGLLIARTPNSSVGTAGGCYKINRVQITGTFAQAGLANSSADQSTLDGCYIEGPVGVVISYRDLLGVGSKYVSLSPNATANTYNAINNCIGIIGLSRACVLDESFDSLVCNNSFFDTYTGCPSYFELIGTGYKSLKLYGCRGENSGANDPVYIVNLSGTSISSQGGHLEGEFESSTNGVVLQCNTGSYFSQYFTNIQLLSLQGKLINGGIKGSIIYNSQSLPSTLTNSYSNVVIGGSNSRTEWTTTDNVFLSTAGAVYINTVINGTPTATVSPSGDTTGATDYTNIQGAINSLPASGGTVFLTNSGPYYISTGLTIGNGTNSATSTCAGVMLMGQGEGGDANSYRGGILLNSLVAGPAITIKGTVGGWGLQNIAISVNSSSASAVGLKVISGQGGHVERFSVDMTHASQIGILETCNTYTGGNGNNTQHNTWTGINIWMGASAANAIGWEMSGTTTGNTCFENVTNLQVLTSAASQTGLYLDACDSNNFQSYTLGNGGTASKAVVFNYGNVGSAGWPANCYFFGIDVGTSTFTNSGTPAGASPNDVFGFGLTNGGSIPTLSNLTVYQ